MNILAIIPARSGSKGIPNKNILPLNGHPLIAYSIKAALGSKLINRVIVSTDSKLISQISKDYGAETPFVRPSKFAQDNSTDLEVFNHALNWLKINEEYKPDIIVQIRPTSPVRKTEIIDNCIEKCINSDCDSLRVVTESPLSPYKMWHIDGEKSYMRQFSYLKGVSEPYNQPRQKLPKVYWQIGFLDVMKVDTILNQKSMTGSRILPYLVDKKYAIDIDDIYSFERASEALLNSNYVNFNR